MIEQKCKILSSENCQLYSSVYTIVARRDELSPNMVNRWVKEYKAGNFDESIQAVGTSPLETKKLSQENDQLKRLLGEKDLEIAILRDLIKKKSPHLLTNLK